MAHYLTTFEDVRYNVEKFCLDRDWGKYHTPMNLALALCGECGEVCEIFQWKGPIIKEDIKEGDIFKKKEIINIGEEIADVCIYLCRLSDICALDLVSCICGKIQSLKQQLGSPPPLSKWHYLELDFIRRIPADTLPQLPVFFRPAKPRQIVMQLVSAAGHLCTALGSCEESDACVPGLPMWTTSQRADLGDAIADVALALASLALQSNINIGEVVTDKFLKNEAKYPAEMVRGSSEKYTYYKERIAQQQQSQNTQIQPQRLHLHHHSRHSHSHHSEHSHKSTHAHQHHELSAKIEIQRGLANPAIVTVGYSIGALVIWTLLRTLTK